MVNSGNANPCREMMARSLAKQAAKLAKEGDRAESERVFKRAFGEVRLVKAHLGGLKGDVHERSRLATVLADEAFSAGMGAAFAVGMWKYGCNSGCLGDDERGDTDMFYPIEIMAMAEKEKKELGTGNGEEDAAPPAVCEVEKEKRIPIPWPIRFVVSTWRSLFFGGEEGGKRERP